MFESLLAFWYTPIVIGLIGVGICWGIAVILLLRKIVVTKPKARPWFDWVFLVVMSVLLVSFAGFIWQFTLADLNAPDQPLIFNVLWVTVMTLIGAGLVSLPFALLTLMVRVFCKRELPGWFNRAWLLLPIALVVGFLTILWLDSKDNAFASDYFQLHAAIKNTCLLDPKREHCPTKLEEISYIEPEEFKRLASKTDFIYTYDPATNQYTFIARPSAKRAVVFDQRLLATEGVDFKEYNVITWGQDRLEDAPPFPGPWELPEWDHWWGR